MKKISTWFLIALLAISFGSLPVLAETKGCTPGCAKTCPAAKACPTMKAADSTSAATLTEIKECASLTLAIEGMTCAGCEAKISEILNKMENTYHVESISHKEGKAIVCINPKANTDDILKAVANLGYKASVTELKAIKECAHGKADCKIGAKTE